MTFLFNIIHQTWDNALMSSDPQFKPEQWNTKVSHPLQSWEWASFREKMGVPVIRFTKTTPFQSTIHSLPHTPYRVGYVPKGPPITPALVDELTSYGKKHNIIYFQLEPNSLKQQHPPITIPTVRPSHHPLFTQYTFVLDLSLSEDTLLKNMHPKTRYNIKVAQKHNVTIAEDNSEYAFGEYLKLVEETTQRQGFYAHSPAYHKTMWKTLYPSGIARLFTATYNNHIVAAWILFGWQKTLYYPYGASSRTVKNVMAPYLLLWEIIRWAKKEGYQSFDLWGALGEHPKEDDPFYGFHRFKSGFNPQLIEFVGSYDVIIQPALYTLYCLADTARWFFLHRQKK
jgi:lipid II:glycine glycyltransferase (peptidoglycan interpeptide bridge formation enzyme)